MECKIAPRPEGQATSKLTTTLTGDQACYAFPLQVKSQDCALCHSALARPTVCVKCKLCFCGIAHATQHARTTRHALLIDIKTLSIFCSLCDDILPISVNQLAKKTALPSPHGLYHTRKHQPTHHRKDFIADSRSARLSESWSNLCQCTLAAQL